jgi:hypothetical protein
LFSQSFFFNFSNFPCFSLKFFKNSPNYGVRVAKLRVKIAELAARVVEFAGKVIELVANAAIIFLKARRFAISWLG